MYIAQETEMRCRRETSQADNEAVIRSLRGDAVMSLLHTTPKPLRTRQRQGLLR